jgi:RNA polymerase primary sigma factor
MIATRERLLQKSSQRPLVSRDRDHQQAFVAVALATERQSLTSDEHRATLGAWKQRLKLIAERPIEFIAADEFAVCDLADTSLPDSLLAGADEGEAAERRLASEFGTPLARACEARLLTAAEERALFRRMNYLKYHAHQMREWLNPQTSNDVALREIESCLTEAESLRNRIIAANVRLVISIVKTFTDQRNSFEDLISDGIVSMMHAVEKFDYDRGFRFSTYATRAIRRNLYRLLLQRQKDRARFAPSGSDHILEFADERGVSAINEQRWNELQGQLKRMLKALDPRERMIVRARFGMDKTGQVQTLQAIAKSLGVCKERVRQLEKRALDKLQKMVSEVRLEEPAM